LEDWKIKVSVLWLFAEVAGLASVMLMFMEQDVLVELVEEGTIAGMQMSSDFLLLGAVLLLVPLIMAFLSLTLKDRINRWLNIIVGIVFIVLIPIGTGFGLIPTAYLPSMIVIAIVEIVALALIVWYAWKSKQKA